jgi:hypothetical protein
VTSARSCWAGSTVVRPSAEREASLSGGGQKTCWPRLIAIFWALERSDICNRLVISQLSTCQHPSVSTAISAISVLSAYIGHAISSVSDGVFLIPKLIDKDTRLAEHMQLYRELDGRLPKSCVSELLAEPAQKSGVGTRPCGWSARRSFLQVQVPLQALVSCSGAIFLPMGHSLRRCLLLVLVGLGVGYGH